jgi:hypothetical protein
MNALHLIATKLMVIGKNTCERTGCHPEIMANGFVIAGLTELVRQVGGERAATWLRGLADQVEDLEAGDDLPETIQ